MTNLQQEGLSTSPFDLKPIREMYKRLESSREDSDAYYFYELLLCGEMIVKLVTAGMLASIQDDREHNSYRIAYSLVRANSIGDWVNNLEEVIRGAASSFMLPEARDVQKELTQQCGRSLWQYDAVESLHNCLVTIGASAEDLPHKVQLLNWFKQFSELRNKTRGHGALSSASCARLCVDLQQSIAVLCRRLSLFKRPWAYLYRNLSGKYRVTRLTPDCSTFDKLKTTKSASYEDGVHIAFGNHHMRIDMMLSDPDSLDFYFPNGDFKNKEFEIISYISGDRRRYDGSAYMRIPGTLPPSETEGLTELEVVHDVLSNMPPYPQRYVSRKDLEAELVNHLHDDRHPVITLLGPGGIGKTSLAIAAIHDLARSNRFSAILWFSARDIDLLMEGPKGVRPKVLNEKDIAAQFAALIPPKRGEKYQSEIDYFGKSLQKSPGYMGGPILFVFDNFETVRNPIDLFRWLDTQVRPPNKILITTRSREFKGDYPVEISGMSREESLELISNTASHLGIVALISDGYAEQLYSESGGHPYVMKILLGEVAKAGHPLTTTRILASEEEILIALFERTYTQLSPAGRRVFLTLCNWRSAIPKIALHAILLRPANRERIDIDHALDELMQRSLIEISELGQEEILYISVPLAAQSFGRKKLEVAPWKVAIEIDTELLQQFGVFDLRHGRSKGFELSIDRFLTFVSEKASQAAKTLVEYEPILEAIARQYPPAWLRIAKLFEELGSTQDLGKAIEKCRRLIEVTADIGLKIIAWREIARLAAKCNESLAEIQAIVELSSLQIPFSELSGYVNRINGLLRFYSDKPDLAYEEITVMIKNLTKNIEKRMGEADAIDCSRIAWLYARLGNTKKFDEIVERGLKMEPDNYYCNKMKARKPQ